MRRINRNDILAQLKPITRWDNCAVYISEQRQGRGWLLPSNRSTDVVNNPTLDNNCAFAYSWLQIHFLAFICILQSYILVTFYFILCVLYAQLSLHQINYLRLISFYFILLAFNIFWTEWKRLCIIWIFKYCRWKMSHRQD